MKKPGKMLRKVLSSIFIKPATTAYPRKKFEMPDKFRGKIVFHPDLCIGCRICMRDCPAGAINIMKVGEKTFEAEIDLSKCIYCAQCVDSCPKKALEISGAFELASLDKSRLKIRYHAKSKDVS